MTNRTRIEWATDTWEVTAGCTRVSPGCENCYAERLSYRLSFSKSPAAKAYAKATEGWPEQPVRWSRAVIPIDTWLDKPLKRKKPERYFVNSRSDLFHKDVPDAAIDRVFATAALCPQHRFILLTKRPERMAAYMAERWQGTPAQRFEYPDGRSIDIPAGGETGRRFQIEEACEPLLDQLGLVDTSNDDLWTDDGKCKAMQWSWPLPNVILGISAEDQPRLEERWPHLERLAAAGWHTLLSAEPLLGPLDLTKIRSVERVKKPRREGPPAPSGIAYTGNALQGIKWPVSGIPETIRTGKLGGVIAGGESGPDARPGHPDWFRALRDDCAAAGTPFFFKQWGESCPLRNELVPVPPKNIGWVARDGRFKFNCSEADHRPMYRDDDEHGAGYWSMMVRVGKKAAGCTLDGRTHLDLPDFARLPWEKADG